ncbi:MAG: PTS sugar transporter subunit IIC [Erysipelotrichaceae bacterium]|nr:PTS sugar transporter subunit IIC [Erysipelotrichaceae bacterium]
MENEKLTRKKVSDFLLKSLNGMAYGFFATLIIGTIFGTIGTLFKYGQGNPFCDFMVNILGTGDKGFSNVLQIVTGFGIGVGVGLALKFESLKVITLGFIGQLAAYFSLKTDFVTLANHPVSDGLKIGDPLTILIVVISAALLMQLILKKKTPVDIILIPLFGGVIGLLLSLGVRYPAIYVTYAVQWLINASTNSVPFVMGIVVSVLMGMALTAPISSAAIAAMIFIYPSNNDITLAMALTDPNYSGLLLASGAAIVGCSTQMIGFMIQSRKDNNIGAMISIGIGTSMLQFKNIVKKPIIWLPTIIASAILGPVSTMWLKLICIGPSAGMGTAGLVGQIGTLGSMGVGSWQAWVGIFGLQIVAPALLVFGIDLLFRKLKWIKEGDLKL